MKISSFRSYYKYIPVLIVVFGMALRLNVYFQNRSFIIDEANLARYVIKNEWPDFFGYQDKKTNYHQYAPPLFSVLSKASIALGGTNEYALKGPSVLTGLFTLILLAMLLNLYWGNSLVGCYILLVFACSVLSIRYSTEFKQYASDTFLALAFIYAALRSKTKNLTLKNTMGWALAGAIAVWMSMSIIFILAAIGFAFLYNWQLGNLKFRYLMAIGTLWLLSFGCYFFIILQKDAGDPNLVSYHSPFFFEGWPNSLEALKKDYQLLVTLFRTTTDQTVLSILFAIGSFLTGLVQLFRKDKYSLILLLTPIVLSYIASAIHFYTLIERLILFLVPFVLLIMAHGLHFIWKKAPLLGKALVLTCMIFSVVNSLGYRYYWTKMEFEDSKSMLSYIKQNGPTVPIFVQHDAQPAFVFYNHLHDNAWKFDNYYLAKWNEMPSDNYEGLLKKTTTKYFWLFLSHTHPKSYADKFVYNAQTFSTLLKNKKSILSSTYLFQPR